MLYDEVFSAIICICIVVLEGSEAALMVPSDGAVDACAVDACAVDVGLLSLGFSVGYRISVVS